MSEQKNELRQIITDALVSMVSGVTGLVPPSGPGAIPDFIQAPIDRAIEKIAASLPVGVPDGYALVPVSATREQKNSVCMHPDLAAVLYSNMVKAAPAAPTVKAEQPDMAEAYVGAREDLAIWKRRALEAEQKVRHQEQVIDHLTLEAQGETRFGEPSIPSAEPVAVIEYAGYDPANSIKWLNKGLQYLEPGTLLYAQAPSLPAAGSAELEEAASILRNMIDSIDVHGNYSKESTLLFLNQALSSMTAALSAQQSVPERVSVPVELLETTVAVLESAEERSTAAEIRALLASHQRGEA